MTELIEAVDTRFVVSLVEAVNASDRTNSFTPEADSDDAERSCFKFESYLTSNASFHKGQCFVRGLDLWMTSLLIGGFSVTVYVWLVHKVMFPCSLHRIFSFCVESMSVGPQKGAFSSVLLVYRTTMYGLWPQ